MSLGNFSLPENCKWTLATATTTTNATVTYDSICIKDAHKVWLVAFFLNPTGHATTITPKVGASDPATTSITFSANWWLSSDTATIETPVKQTAATTMACGSGSTNNLMIIEIDPAAVTAQGSTYDWVAASSATSSQAGNYVTAFWVTQPRYQQAAPIAVTA